MCIKAAMWMERLDRRFPKACALQAVVETGENSPAAQAVHVDAPAAFVVSVALPFPHTSHGTVDVLVNLPAMHALQDVAPTEANWSVWEPESHKLQAAVAAAE